MAKTIKIVCKGSRLATLSKLEVIQGDLKELSRENYEKLRKRIETKGFDAPLFVWKGNILDGTQRYRVLVAMIEEGWVLPAGKVPVCDIKAKDLKEAKERVLGYVSQYGKVTHTGLNDFLNGIEEPDFETMNLPEFDFSIFDRLYLHPPENLQVPDTELPDEDPEAPAAPAKMQVMCPTCGSEFEIDV